MRVGQGSGLEVIFPDEEPLSGRVRRQEIADE
jgi:hypothetical protein